jgi:hypothetical protein
MKNLINNELYIVFHGGSNDIKLDGVTEHFAKSCNAIYLKRKEFEKEYNNLIKNYNKINLIIRGLINLHKFKLLNIDLDYYYIDTGYFGNLNSYYCEKNILYKKNYHRILKNTPQIKSFSSCKNNRYNEVINFIQNNSNLTREDVIKPWKKDGKNILVCPISKEASLFYGINKEDWLDQTIEIIKKNSDRKIIIRERPKSRAERINNIPIQKQFDLDDIYATISHDSIISVESIIHGIPTYCTGLNAALPVSIKNIEEIENPKYLDRNEWLYNLCNNQFLREEMSNKKIIKYLNNI